MIEDEVVGWHHQLNGHEFEQTPGDSEGEGILVYRSPSSPITSQQIDEETVETVSDFILGGLQNHCRW